MSVSQPEGGQAPALHGVFYYRHTPEMLFQDVSAAVASVLGCSAAMFRRDYPTMLVDDAARQQLEAYMLASKHGVQQPPCELGFYHRDGQLKHLLLSETPELTTTGELLAVQGMAVDVTVQKQQCDQQQEVYQQILKQTSRIRQLWKDTQRSFEREKSRYKSMIRNSFDAVLIADLKGQIQEANPAAIRMFGWRLHELRRKHISDILPFLSHDVVQQSCFGHINEVRAVHKNCRPLCLEAIPIRVSLRDASYLSVTVRDVSARKQSERQLREHRQALDRELQLIDRLLAAIPSILIAVDSAGHVSLWNDVAATVFGLAGAAVKGALFAELPIAWDWDVINRAAVASVESHVYALEHVKFRRSDGSDGYLELTINAVPEDGAGNGFLLVGADTTEQVQLENQLQVAQKMESIGELAAGIAHEINTPMQYIGDNVRFLQDGFVDLLQLIASYHQAVEATGQGRLVEPMAQAEADADIDFLREEVPLAVSQTLEGIAHVSKIVSAMKELSHPGTGSKMAIDINKVIENSVTVSKNEWKYVAALQLDLATELPMVYALPEINQVFLNIIINAAHAIADVVHGDEKGSIRISTASLGDMVEIRIADTGPGIDAGQQHKIFDPFFTTKEPGKGTGQGLAISHQIVCKRLHGQLLVESEAGHGATFVIQLPLGSDDADADTAAMA